MCKPVGGDASNVLDILMLIADPEAEGDSRTSNIDNDGADNINIADSPGKSVEFDEVIEGDIDHQARLKWLEQSGYNPALISSEYIACDLLTDSWLQLKTGYVAARQRQLMTKHAECNSHVETLLIEMFGFENIHAVKSGRHAEAALCESWPKNKKAVSYTHLTLPTKA